MLNFYIVIFLVGVLYTFVSLIISGFSGAMHSHGDFGGGADADIGTHGHINLGHVQADTGHMGHTGHFHGGQADAGHHSGDMQGGHTHSADGNGGNNILSWFAILLNPLVAVAFLTVFGGFGILGEKLFDWLPVIVFVVSLASGVIVSAVLYNFVAKPIYASENTSDVSREQLVGLPAEVTTDILENGYGTIKYTVNSIMYVGPAKHIEEKSLKQGVKVVICKIENNTFFVSELSEVLN